MKRTQTKYTLTNQALYLHVHKKLTFLFTVIAGLILVILSVSYLNMSEKELKSNSRLSFSSESNTILANFKEQKTLSSAWLSGISMNKSFFLAVYDNGAPFSYNNTHLTEEQKTLSTAVLKTAVPSLTALSTNNYEHVEFSYESEDSMLYYVNAARIGSSDTPLYVMVLFSTEALMKQLARQRLFFLLIDSIGVLALLFFSWYYTGKLLAPILESQMKQNEFIAAASHELRTPLAVSLSCIEAHEKSNDPAEKKRLLSTMETEAKRMSSLIDDLLTLARADSQSWNMAFSDTELDTLLLNSYEAFLPLATEAEISLEIALPEDTLSTCYCDPDRITQVLAVLISNAISYGKRDGYIKLSLSCNSAYFIICVEDNGTGISDEAKKHIFDRFYREDSSRSKKDHFGLGLSIAKEIALAHGGELSVSDTSGGGATFSLRLPISGRRPGK